MQDWQSRSHVKWHVRNPSCSRRSSIGARSMARRTRDGRISTRAVSQPRAGDCGGACDAEPHPPVPEQPTEGQCGEHCGICEREVGNPHSSSVPGSEGKFLGLHLRARGYCVSEVGLDEATSSLPTIGGTAPDTTTIPGPLGPLMRALAPSGGIHQNTL
jgi:hypothetical protein